MTRLFALSLVVTIWAIAPARAFACADRPRTIQVDALFETILDDLLASSPTFARQCERIAGRPLVNVSVRPLPNGEDSCCRAKTTIRRYSSGALIAWIEIPSPRIRLEHAELFGHEFEHILEQIELLDLRAQADEGAGAVRLWNGAYETARARLAGERVALEAAVSGKTSAERRPPR